MAYTEGFLKLLSSYKAVRILSSETSSLFKNANAETTIKVNRGAGIAGVNPRLLTFHTEMDERLHEIKEVVGGE